MSEQEQHHWNKLEDTRDFLWGMAFFVLFIVLTFIV